MIGLVTGHLGAHRIHMLQSATTWLSAPTLRKFRRHSIVAILIVVAVITPTPDPVTLCVLALPLWGLYELAIVVLSRSSRRSA